MSAFKLNGVEIPEPNYFDIEHFEVGQSNRLASGNLASDFVAVKRKFEMAFPFLYWQDLKKFHDAYDTRGFINFTFQDKGVTDTAIVLIPSIKSRLKLTDADPNKWIYRDITITLEEK